MCCTDLIFVPHRLLVRPGSDHAGQAQLHRAVAPGVVAARRGELSGGREQGCGGHLDSALYGGVRRDPHPDRAALQHVEREGGPERGPERGLRLGAGRGREHQPGDQGEAER